MPHHHHHLIANILHLIAGGGIGLVAAALAQHIGARSADRMPGDSRAPECFYCLRPLTWQDISPLFGWLLRPDTLNFPCPCGLRKNQWTQPAVEILGLLFGVIGMYLADWGWTAVPLCIGLGLLPAIAMIDLQFRIIPDGLNMLLGVLGLWWLYASGGDRPSALIVAGSLLAVGLFFALVYSRWRGKEMLGLGDVKFLAAAGLWLRPDLAPWFLTVAGGLGVGIGFLWRYLGGDKEFPFAPALCLSLVIFVLVETAQMP